MKKLFFLLALFFSQSVFAMDFYDMRQFKAMTQFANHEMGLKMGIPRNFYVMDVDYRDFYHWSRSPYSLYSGVALSEDKNALLVYPMLLMVGALGNNSQWVGDGCTGLKNMSYLMAGDDEALSSPKILTDTKMCGRADTIIISEVRLSGMSSYHFNRQVLILMNKRGYVPMYFRLLLNDSSAVQKEKIIESVLRVMKFGKETDFVKKKSKDFKYFPMSKFLKAHNYYRYFHLPFLRALEELHQEVWE